MTTRREFVRVRGLVQGVGFRPFVFRLATDLGLDGYVGNDHDGVFIAVEGTDATLDEFVARLARDIPPLARVSEIHRTREPVRAERGFRVVESRESGSARTFLAPDAATCADCLSDLLDPANRRFRYPFTTCTNCGPRFTITTRLPYDRPHTTMAHFAMCPECAAEYNDPADRRFHAQPIACAACGPTLVFESDQRTEKESDDAIAAAQEALAQGAIVAVKGLGGYHLACDARRTSAVARLRERKQRPAKPFAVMGRDIETLRRVAVLSDSESSVLSDPAGPIVLCEPQRGHELADGVAPASPRLGLFLPYTPLHHLLLRRGPGRPVSVPDLLVMTSGNLSDEPICFDDDDARTRLSHVADAWLVHDRPIHVPCDDSVVIVDRDELVLIRRSRGFAPFPVTLPFAVAPTVATGGELKNAFGVAVGRDAWLGQHLGDMGSLDSLTALEKSMDHLSTIYGVTNPVVATDAHPGYHVARVAAVRGTEPVLVQHHHAHIAAVMAEHGVPDDEIVIGVALDGTGYGTDHTIWGGEILRVTYRRADRVGHLASVSMPGGDAVIRHPYRAALAHLRAAGIAWDDSLAPVAAATARERAVIARQLVTGLGCMPSSSVGRLFDAVASLCGLCQHARFEAEGAIALEALATGASGARPYAFGELDNSLDPTPLLVAIVSDLLTHVPAADVAAGFHVAIADSFADAAARQAQLCGARRVALGGGVFQNLLLRRLMRERLAISGLDVLVPRAVPVNDGGLALGQILVAASQSTTP